MVQRVTTSPHVLQTSFPEPSASLVGLVIVSSTKLACWLFSSTMVDLIKLVE
jgi:hypothetical protein